MSQSRRVGIVGAGNVGSTVAFILAMNGSCHEIILRDNKTDIAKGKALDMSQAAAAAKSHTTVKVADTADKLKDCDVVVITAGSPRKPGMSRNDLLLMNAEVASEVVRDIKKYSPNAIIITVSNPLDAITYVALKESGFDRSRVIGMAGILDSSRMASFILEKLGYGAGQIRASVIGGHGDDMVPLPAYCTIAGVPLTDLLTDREIDDIIERTKHGGAEIVGYLKSGSAYYAPAKATATMVEAILDDTKQIFPCAALLEGEYGYNDVVCGVPVMLGAKGMEKIIEVTLNQCEKKMFKHSINSVKELIDTLKSEKFFEKQKKGKK